MITGTATEKCALIQQIRFSFAQKPEATKPEESSLEHPSNPIKERERYTSKKPRSL